MQKQINWEFSANFVFKCKIQKILTVLSRVIWKINEHLEGSYTIFQTVPSINSCKLKKILESNGSAAKKKPLPRATSKPQRVSNKMSLRGATERSDVAIPLCSHISLISPIPLISPKTPYVITFSFSIIFDGKLLFPIQLLNFFLQALFE